MRVLPGLRGLTLNSCGTSDASEQDDDGGGVEEGLGGGDGSLEVFGEATVAPDPGEEALDSWTKGHRRRDARSSGGAPSRSWMLPGWVCSIRARPSVSTMACRLRDEVRRELERHDLTLWFWLHRSEVEALLAQGEIDWTTAAERFEKQGLLVDGQRPIAATTLQTGLL